MTCGLACDSRSSPKSHLAIGKGHFNGQVTRIVIARPVHHNELRTYRIARFKSLRELETAADVPADFDLRGYFGNAWGIYRGDTTYDVEIYFTPQAAAIVTETT